MEQHTYQISPIDSHWEHLKTVRKTLRDLASENHYAQIENDIDILAIQDFLSSWEAAKVAAKTIGWQGDFRHEPVVIQLPNDGEFSYGFVFKQDDNGTTYVISPVAMPWLDQTKTIKGIRS